MLEANILVFLDLHLRTKRKNQYYQRWGIPFIFLVIGNQMFTSLFDKNFLRTTDFNFPLLSKQLVRVLFTKSKIQPITICDGYDCDNILDEDFYFFWRNSPSWGFGRWVVKEVADGGLPRDVDMNLSTSCCEWKRLVMDTFYIG